jgi:hypothetical protein
MMLACCNSSFRNSKLREKSGSTEEHGSFGGKTGWQNVNQYFAARTLPARPAPVTDPRGLQTDVPGDVAEAVMLMPSLLNENSCLRSIMESTDWCWGSNALGAMADELGVNGKGAELEGAQNWWQYYHDTQQNQQSKEYPHGYPMSIAGIESKDMRKPYDECRTVTQDAQFCNCKAAQRDAALQAQGERPTEHKVFV